MRPHHNNEELNRIPDGASARGADLTHPVSSTRLPRDVLAAEIVDDVFDESSKDSSVISTMIERDFLVAIERQQRSLAANHATHARVREAQRYSRHWLSVLMTDWWPSRSA